MISDKIKILSVLVAWVLTGCNSWLDVKPYDKMVGEQVYATEQGIQKELNGLYLLLASDDLYGWNLSAGMPEVMAQHYYITNTERNYYKLSRYQYTDKDVKPLFETIWSAAYKLITNCNGILKNLPEHWELLTQQHYRLTLGEALAVRTYMHFDLFRLFGPVYKEETKTEASIPYYNEVTDIPSRILPAGELVEQLMTDIDSAIVLLKEDPILTEGVVLEDDDFWAYRNTRLNYFAAWALKARICWYCGEEYQAEAYHIATALLEGKDPETGVALNFREFFPAITKDATLKDRSYCPELLFGLHNLKRDQIYKNNFSPDLDSKTALLGLSTFISGLYSDVNDVRNNFWETSSSDPKMKIFVRYYPQSVIAADKNPYTYEMQSMVRISELFLIAAASASDETLQVKWLEEERVNRGYQLANMAGLKVNSILDKEWQKEFYGEGQYFFYLKRNEIKSIKSQDNKKLTIDFRIPLPENETNNRYE